MSQNGTQRSVEFFNFGIKLKKKNCIIFFNLYKKVPRSRNFMKNLILKLMPKKKKKK